ncbi:MAG: hypothetical protein KDF54_15260 [Hydrogenophaga sp.]|nr:hypothetical protein [Hydrogenophaga sp.]
MKQALLAWILWCAVTAANALSPYTGASPVTGADLGAQMAAVEKKLQASGFELLGRHVPKGLAKAGGVVLVTDPAMRQIIRDIGGSAIVAAPIRVAVHRDGRVSYMTPEYWYRAFLRKQYPKAESAVSAIQTRLTQSLGTGSGFGGDVPTERLADYQYMMSMERFDAIRSELRAFVSFDEAIRTVRRTLGAGVGSTAKVYELVMPEKRVAVFGVALNDTDRGEAWWVNKLGPTGPDHLAALPYEIFVVGNKVYSLAGRYRIALGWPALGLGDFMNIRYAPDVIQSTMDKLAEVPELQPSN